MSRHVALFGDSIFDNAAYIAGGPDVATLLRGMLDPGDRVTLKAIDGSVCSDAVHQLSECPSDVTHVVVSAGGNDILHHAAKLQQRVGSVAEALRILDDARAEFLPQHANMAHTARKIGLPAAICTIYDANMGAEVTVALAIFNDAITRNIHTTGLDLIDLRLVCDETADFANPIEPSVQGGAKIAAAIARYVRAVDAPGERTRVFH